MKKIKAILFDMDGVLIDAKDWHYEALNKALSLFGYEITRAEHLSSYDGLPTRVKLEKLSLEKGLPKQLHSFINEMKQQYTYEFVQRYCRPVFSHEYALSNLKSKGYIIGCCSNSIRKSIDMMMHYASLDKYLDIIISNEDVSQAKPSPEIYLKAMNELGVNPEDCLICEDNINGIKAALASGGYLYKVDSIDDICLKNIINKIKEIENA